MEEMRTMLMNTINGELGVYFLILETAKGQVTTKLMKNENTCY